MRWLVWLTVRERQPVAGIPGKHLLARDVMLGHVEAPDKYRAERQARHRFVSLHNQPLRVQSEASWRLDQP
jgi:hypothetical protein